MELKKVTIDNFRNINHAEYELGRLNVFTGPNRMGKTNTILAIYWAMTDTLLDGSKDYASIKPIGNKQAETSVKLEFDDGWKLEKKFKEKWTKTRGSNEVTMTGHETTFLINDIKTKPTDAIKEISKKFSVFDKTSVGKFDLLQAIVNPYYLARNDWKITRKFIVELVGDVNDKDVITANPNLLRIAGRLEMYSGDSDKAKKFYQAQVKENKAQADLIQGKIEGLQMVKDVSSDDLEAAQAKIQQVNETIAELKNGKRSENPELALKQSELAKLRQSAGDLEAAEKNALNKENDVLMAKKQQISADSMDAQNAAGQAKRELISLDNNIADKQLKKNQSELRLADLQKSVESLRKQYVTTKKSLDGLSNQEMKCPHCGYVLNADSIDQQRKGYQNQLDQLAQDGKSRNLEIENEQQKIREYEEKLTALEAERGPKKDAYEKAKENVQSYTDRINEIHMKTFTASADLQALWKQITDKQEEIYTLQAADANDTSLGERIADLRSQTDVPNNVISQHAAYQANQKQIHELELQLNTVQKSQMEAEQDLALCDAFIKAKLEMFNEKVASVFGTKIHFTLIENNIKEGSWSEVCYPSVLDKDTAFLNGSGSEQILAGIYIAECIKKKLGIADLPYIFDECDKLDTKSLAGIDTKAQMITTKVDDVNYSKITLVKGE